MGYKVVDLAAGILLLYKWINLCIDIAYAQRQAVLSKDAQQKKPALNRQETSAPFGQNLKFVAD